jgi:glycerol-3-phosphate acyltransferase PlsY
MPGWLYFTAWLAASFLLGSIPFGYLVARWQGVDIRSVGSGNIGMTNVWRTLGWQAGATVLALDMVKGFLPVLGVGLTWHAEMLRLHPEWERASSYASNKQWYEWWSFGPWLWLAMLAGLAAVLGHTFTPWLGFKGGKGVATGGGVLLALLGSWALVPLAAFGLTLAATRMVSAASLLAAYSAAATTIAVPELRLLSVLTLPLAVFVTWTHRENLARIRAGTERRIGRSATKQ